MKTERDVMTTKTVTEYTCDVCKKMISPMFSKGAAALSQCIVCHRDVCSDCEILNNRNGSAFPSPFCIHCWNAGQAWRKLQWQLVDAHTDQVQDLESAWYREAKAKVEAKSKR